MDRTDRSFVLTARYVLRNCICENDEAGAKIPSFFLLIWIGVPHVRKGRANL